MKKQGGTKIYILIVACILLSKVLGMARNMFLSAYYGTGMEAEVFTAVSKLPLTLYDVTLGTAIVSAFIPVFNERLAQNGKNSANRFGSNFLTLAALFSTAVCALGMCFPELFVKIVASGFDDSRMALAVPMMRSILPVILFATAAYIFIGILQSYGEFTAPALVSLFTNLAIILYFVFFNQHFGIKGLAVAFTIGWSLQLLFLLPFVIKRGYRYRFICALTPDIKKVLLLTLPLFISSLAQPINTLISTNLSSSLSDGALATLNYAYEAYFILAAVFASAMTNLYFPEMSRRFAEGDTEGATDIGQTMLKTVSAIILPITVFMSVCGTPIIRVLYQRGEFTAENTAAVASCLAVYCVGMLALSWQEILNKFFYSMQNSKIPMIAALGGILLNLGTSFLFIRLIGQYRLLAVATVISGWFMAGVLMWFARKKAPKLIGKSLAVSLGKTLGASAGLGVVAFALRFALEKTLGTGMLATVGTVAASLLMGGAVYILLLKLFRSEELGELLSKRREKRG